MRWITGNRYVSVLPLPVWLATRKLPPLAICGMALAWISVGVTSPSASVAAISSGSKPSSAKESPARAAGAGRRLAASASASARDANARDAADARRGAERTAVESSGPRPGSRAKSLGAVDSRGAVDRRAAPVSASARRAVSVVMAIAIASRRCRANVLERVLLVPSGRRRSDAKRRFAAARSTGPTGRVLRARRASEGWNLR